jgi:hypothetical protein
LGAGTDDAPWTYSDRWQAAPQEGWLAKNAVNNEDREAAAKPETAEATAPADPMRGLEELDVAGPKPEWHDEHAGGNTTCGLANYRILTHAALHGFKLKPCSTKRTTALLVIPPDTGEAKRLVRHEFSDSKVEGDDDGEAELLGRKQMAGYDWHKNDG